MRSEKGFTLIEIIIAVLIMTFISTMTAFSIKQSVNHKKRLERDMDDYAQVRDALVIMTRDINHGFHWFDIDGEIRRRIGTDAAAASGQAAPSPTPSSDSNFIPVEKITGFIGDKESMYLTVLGHPRIVADSKESDQAKVGYYLKDIKTLHDGIATKGLVRRESTVLDGELLKGGKEVVLVEYVKLLKFRYLGNDDKEWVDTWKSIDTNDDAQKNKFPDAVEITITTDHDKREVSLSTVAAVYMPNNDPFHFSASATPGPTQAAAGVGAPGTGQAPAANPATGLPLQPEPAH